MYKLKLFMTDQNIIYNTNQHTKMENTLFTTVTESNIQKNKYNFNSICIPRMNISISKWEISDAIKRLDLGTIERIDEVNNYNHGVKRVFIHIKKWNKCENSLQFVNIMNQNGHVNVVYKFPHFWKCYINNVKKK